MDFNICPRTKKALQQEGTFRFEGLKVFCVGEASLFFSAMKHFCPELPLEKVALEEANVTISVAEVYSSKNEYCYLRITEKGMEIHCRDNNGARNAAAILKQIMERDEKGFALSCGVIEDWPDTQYRAMMLESSGRAWISMDRFIEYIREMAICRMNVFQFHFMESPGCTVELDCLPNFKGFGKDNLKYTKDQVREMIAYAADLGITVTPFVEVLSHAKELALAAGINCPGDPLENMYDVCLGQEKTFEVIEMVLAEVAELFPDPVLHIGADEYDMGRVTPKTAYWDRCPHCRALSEKMGYTTLRELFLYGINRINRIVNKLGKVMMMWNADIRPGYLPQELDRNIIIHYYRENNDLGKERIFNLNMNGYVEEGFSVLNSFYPETYMDVSRYMKVANLVGWSPLNRPLVKKGNEAKIPGGCCCAWEDYEHYWRTIPAAIVLFADRLWNAEGDPVIYDNAYGQMMTRALFEGKLPRDMNVFAAVGEVLPPRDTMEYGKAMMKAFRQGTISPEITLFDDVSGQLPPRERKELIYPGKITAELPELEALRDALATLANGGDLLAKAYLECAEYAIDTVTHPEVYTGPVKNRKEFDG